MHWRESDLYNFALDYLNSQKLAKSLTITRIHYTYGRGDKGDIFDPTIPNNLVPRIGGKRYSTEVLTHQYPVKFVSSILPGEFSDTVQFTAYHDYFNKGRSIVGVLRQVDFSLVCTIFSSFPLHGVYGGGGDIMKK